MYTIRKIFVDFVNKDDNEHSYDDGSANDYEKRMKLATYITYINKFVESNKDINIEYDNILIVQKKYIKEIEDMSILEEYNSRVAHLCMLQKLSEVKDGE